jgi:hypothetical protein
VTALMDTHWDADKAFKVRVVCKKHVAFIRYPYAYLTTITHPLRTIRIAVANLVVKSRPGVLGFRLKAETLFFVCGFHCCIYFMKFFLLHCVYYF